VGWGVVGWGGCHTVLWLLHMGCMLRHEIFSCAHADMMVASRAKRLLVASWAQQLLGDAS